MRIYDRERILLAFLSLAPSRPTKTQLFKWMFLCHQETLISRKVAFYDFLPYQYGPFSFVAQYELNRLAKNGLLDLEKLEILSEKRMDVEALINDLDASVQHDITQILFLYGQMNHTELLQFVYQQYPWYASRSRLQPEKHEVSASSAVYTIGYEGKSVDAFLDRLLHRGIHQILDVRCNAYSQKYGFTKGVLEPFCQRLGLSYIHIPELGIPSGKRVDLSTPGAYKKLFKYYTEEILPQRDVFLNQTEQLLFEKPSTLLCFEADPCMCHRGNLSQVLSERTALEIVHL